ncbi:hypothetical protein D3C75_956390 [compost metagenome]
MHHIEAHIPRPRNAHNSVGVGTVIIEQASRLVDNLGNLRDMALEQSQGAGVGQHQRSGVRADGSPQRRQIHHPACIGRDGQGFEPGGGGAGRVGAVG